MPQSAILRIVATFLAVLALNACSEGMDSDVGGLDGGVDAADAPGADTDAEKPAITCINDDEPPEAAEVEVNGWTVRADLRTGAWAVTPAHADEPVLSGPGTCTDNGGDALTPPVRVARGEALVRTGFGNFQIELESENAQLDWTSAADASPEVVEAGGGLIVRWPLEQGAGDDKVVELHFMPQEDDDLAISLVAEADDLDTGEIAMDCRPDESFFGLGSQVTGMDLRGRTYPLWTQEQGNGKPEDGGIFPLNNTPEAAYAPMGIWYSSAGYTAIIGHDHYSELDLCETESGRVHLRSHGQRPGFVLVAGESPRERLTGVTEYTGRLDPAPPAWVLGTWVDAVGGPWRLDEVAQAVRANDIPVSAIWTEDWIGAESTQTGYRLSYAWQWDDLLYPDLPDQISDLHTAGFAFLGYFNPFVPATVEMWDEGTENGYLITDQDGQTYAFQDPAFRTASLVDLTNPDAVAWLHDYQRHAAEELGIDGWMADFAEWLPHDAQMHSGESGWEVHNRYPLLWQEANRDALIGAHSQQSPTNDWTFFARSGWASVNGGSAGTTPTMWGGDQDTNFQYDDGFPTIVPIGAHLGLSGVAIFGSDIAGYNSLGTSNTDKELFFRWSATGAFHPLMRTHHGGDECDNWHFERDADTLAHFRRYASIHTLLFPYFTGLIDQATAHGWPLTRHPYLVEPTRPALWSGTQYQFFLGDDLLVAPVLERGADNRLVTLPEPGWWPLFGDAPVRETNEIVGEAVTASVDADITEIPVFVRPGTALPLLYDVVDSFYGAAEPDITELDDVANKLRVALYPDTDGHVELRSREGLSIFGTGWHDRDSADWSSATVDGVALESCESVDETTSCVDADANTARLITVDDATLQIGQRQLELTADSPHDFIVGLAADAWDAWSTPTSYGGDSADAPSWCEGAPE